MEVRKSTLIKTIIGFVAIFILTLVFIAASTSSPQIKNEPTSNAVTTSGNNQIINLTAKGGYSPSIINAAANKETVLIVNTKNTFDCSAALTIPRLSIQKFLPPNGNTEIKIGSHAPGTIIDGTCSMGMYRFKIKFN